MAEAIRLRSSALRFALITLATVLVVAVTASLGRWQLSRAAQKRAQHSAMLQREALAPLSGPALLEALSGGPDAAHALAFRPVELRGEWLGAATLYLDNRQMNGRPGFFVFTPLRLAGTGATVAVQRGWASRDFNDRARLPEVAQPDGEVLVRGIVAGEPARLFEFSQSAGASGDSPIRQNLTVAQYAAEFSLDLLPLTVVQTGAEGDGLRRDWATPDSGARTNDGYALQWFGLCALVTALYVWFQIIRRFLWRERGPAS